MTFFHDGLQTNDVSNVKQVQIPGHKDRWKGSDRANNVSGEFRLLCYYTNTIVREIYKHPTSTSFVPRKISLIVPIRSWKIVLMIAIKKARAVTHRFAWN